MAGIEVGKMVFWENSQMCPSRGGLSDEGDCALVIGIYLVDLSGSAISNQYEAWPIPWERAG